jgi:hypothetical protein
MRITATLLILTFTGLLFTGCSKSKAVAEKAVCLAPLNVDLHELPVAAVQAQLKGRWELRRVTGGIAGPLMEHPVYHNPFMILSSDHIVLGDDSLGVTVDAPITWSPATYFGSGYVLKTANDAVALVPSEIRNDTLYMLQYAADGVTFHYTRSR